MRAVIALVIILSFGLLSALTQAERFELEGEPDQPHARNGARTLRVIPPGGLLLIPDSNLDRVMAFDPITGDLVDENFLIESAAGELGTPIEAILSPDGTQIWVSDQVSDGVAAYDLDGNYVGWLAPAGGANTSILNNVRGVGLSATQTLLVTSASSPSADVVAEFDNTGAFLGNFVGPNTAEMSGPWDVVNRAAQNDYLVNGSNTDVISRYDASGVYQGVFASIPGMHEQMRELPNGQIVTSNFSTSGDYLRGIYVFNADGSQAYTIFPTTAGMRGNYQLPSGNFLFTDGNGVFEVDSAGTIVATKFSGGSCRYINLVQPQGELGAPQNPLIQVNGAMLTLTWDAVDGAASYHVYSSSDPYAAFETWTLETTVTELTWTTSASTERLYYIVTADSE